MTNGKAYQIAFERTGQSIHLFRLLLDQIERKDAASLLKVKGRWYGRTPLHTACRYNDLETVKCIKDKVDNTEFRDIMSMIDVGMGFTPLHIASERATADLIKVLTDHLHPSPVIDLLKIKDASGSTAVHRAQYGPAPKETLNAYSPYLTKTEILNESAGEREILSKYSYTSPQLWY